MTFDTGKYIEIPYTDKGRGFDGVDCYGLLYLIYKETRRIVLPMLSAEYATANKAEYESLRHTSRLFEGWTEVDEPGVLDVGLFKIGNNFHVGICVCQRPLRMIHILKGSRVTVERVDGIEWENRIKSWWKYGNTR